MTDAIDLAHMRDFYGLTSVQCRLVTADEWSLVAQRPNSLHSGRGATLLEAVRMLERSLDAAYDADQARARHRMQGVLPQVNGLPARWEPPVTPVTSDD